ncbi:MAG: FAD-binding oxidoreductase [Reyranella sp.]|nr:MAG: FAD-binding oxidoreductase [Reyranella sp.]
MRALPETVLHRDITVDALVVGAGISGAITADLLSEIGLAVAIVDRRGPLKGSTPASTALLQYELDTPLTLLSKRIGQTRAERVWRRSKLALDALRERVQHLNIDADCTGHGSLYLEGDVLNEGGLRAEAEARRNAGFETSFLTPSAVKETYGIGRRAGLFGYGNLSADPRRLAAGFLGAALARGARIYAPVDVLAVEASRSFVLASTDAGPTIRASSVVFATGYELPKGVPRSDHKVASTWVIVTKPQPRRLWPGHSFIWEASSPYLYLRTGPKGSIICGGEDEEFSDAETRIAATPAKVSALERKLGHLLPQVKASAIGHWSGAFGISRTGTPSIGPVPSLPNCYAVLGYGGNGITFSMMAAQLLRTAIGGKHDPDAALFSFRRSW